MEQMTEVEATEQFKEYSEFTGAIRISGHYLGCNRLLPPKEAVTIRVRTGKSRQPTALLWKPMNNSVGITELKRAI